MKSELISKLQELNIIKGKEIEELEQKLRDHYNGVDRLKKADRDFINDEIDKIADTKKEISDDFALLVSKVRNLNNFETVEEYRANKKELRSLEEELNNKWFNGEIVLDDSIELEPEAYAEDFEEENDAEEDLDINKNGRRINIQQAKAIALATVTLAAGIVIGSRIKSSVDSYDNETKTSITVKTPTPTVTPKEIIKPDIPKETKKERVAKESGTSVEELFNDASNQEQVAKVASEALDFLNARGYAHDFTQAELENIVKWINHGDVDEASIENLAFAMNRFLDIINPESQNLTDKAFDVSTLFLNGTQGQKLAKQIYNTRVAMLEAQKTDNFKQTVQNYGELLINSWYLMGYNSTVNAYSLEKSGMEAFIDGYFLNTYCIPLANGAYDQDIIVANAGTYNLEDIINEINEQICEDGLNKMSGDMQAAVKDAIRNKEAQRTLK